MLEFETIKRARNWVSERAEFRASERLREPSESTAAGYLLEAKRLMSTGNPWLASLDTTKKETFYRRRAALLHQISGQIKRLLASQDRLQREGNTDSQAWKQDIKWLKEMLDLAEKAPSSTDLVSTKRRETKKKGLGKLPVNWTEIMISRMPKYRAAVQILGLTGCRPSELVAGVLVERIAEGLRITISGAKVGEFSGQESRTFTFNEPFENPIARDLAQGFSVGVATVVQISDARALSGAIRSAGQRAFPGHPESIRPYSFRHQIASDFKALGYTDSLSQALGHRSSETRNSYGSPRHGRAGMAPQAIEATHQVRETRSQIARESAAQSRPATERPRQT